jgi:hypothetical protein
MMQKNRMRSQYSHVRPVAATYRLLRARRGQATSLRLRLKALSRVASCFLVLHRPVVSVVR